MSFLSKNWRFGLVAVVFIIAVLCILVFGIRLGIDFNGGTLYSVELQNQLSAEELSRITGIIAQRIDPSGLRGDVVTGVGGKFIMIQTTETNATELEKIETRIRQQGKFEAALNGETVFTGDEIKRVLRGDSSYGVGQLTADTYEWRLPFVLNDTASERFKIKTFHQCTAVSFTSDGKPVYECERTIFFLDKPNALIVTTQEQYDEDTTLLLTGNRFENIPAETNIEELIEDSQLQVIVVDSNGSLDQNAIATALMKTNIAIVSPDLGDSFKSALTAKGFEVSVLEKKENIAWIWSATKARQVISLTEGVTNEDVADISQATAIGTLLISGRRSSFDDAKTDLEELTILLESGSLPTPVKTISRETISPALGSNFLRDILLMGVVALIAVVAFIVIRYKNLAIAIPMTATIISETVILFGFLALTKNPLDLAAFAGVIAALGSGVNSEVVMVDEILEKSKTATQSILTRVKNALFIITTSTITIIGVMGPIVLFSRNLPGLDKLYGFAVVAIFGAVIGVLITRPAFSKAIESIVSKREQRQIREEAPKAQN